MEMSEQEKQQAAKAYCDHIRSLRVRIKVAEESYRVAAEDADGIKAVRYDVAGKAALARGDDAMVAALQRIEEQRAAIAESMSAWCDECRLFDAACLRLTPVSSLVLTLYYRNGLSWQEVADRLSYGCNYVCGPLHNAALAELYRELPWPWRKESSKS